MAVVMNYQAAGSFDIAHSFAFVEDNKVSFDLCNCCCFSYLFLYHGLACRLCLYHVCHLRTAADNALDVQNAFVRIHQEFLSMDILDE